MCAVHVRLVEGVSGRGGRVSPLLGMRSSVMSTPMERDETFEILLVFSLIELGIGAKVANKWAVLHLARFRVFARYSARC